MIIVCNCSLADSGVAITLWSFHNGAVIYTAGVGLESSSSYCCGLVRTVSLLVISTDDPAACFVYLRKLDLQLFCLSWTFKGVLAFFPQGT